MSSFLTGASILITGGTGSFGRECCRQLLEEHRPSRLIVFSRDELKQSEMAAEPVFQDRAMRFFLGDVRDRDRLERAMSEVDFVIHAAALKQVPAAEYNPLEFIKTNIDGAANVVDAALNSGVKAVLALSTDKAVNPINLYGATKLCSDKIFIAANSYRGGHGPSFAVVRYGNVAGSRGSVIPSFLQQRRNGLLTLTDPRMTRFFIDLSDGVRFALRCLGKQTGGEIFVPKIPSCLMSDLVAVLGDSIRVEIVGIRPGEKMHEVLIPADEAHNTIELEDSFIIEPALRFWMKESFAEVGRRCPEGFGYASDTNPWRLSREELRLICRREAQRLGMEWEEAGD